MHSLIRLECFHQMIEARPVNGTSSSHKLRNELIPRFGDSS